jgi:hypothetical protein
MTATKPKTHYLDLNVIRSGQAVPVRVPILNVQFSPHGNPVGVILGLPRVTKEVWYYDCCLFEEREVIDLCPEEDAFAIRSAIRSIECAQETQEDQLYGN